MLTFGTYAPYDLVLSPFETTTLDLSNTWCRGVQVTDDTSESTLYLAESVPPLLAPTPDTSFNFTGRINSIRYQEYQYWSFRLKPGSSVNITTCVTAGVANFFIIAGEAAFNEWVNGAPLTPREFYTKCDNPSKIFQVTEGDLFYFAYENPQSTLLTARVDIVVNKTEYDLDQTITSCAADPVCALGLRFHTTDIAILKAGPGLPDGGVTVKVACTPRDAFYWALFGGIAGGVIMCFVSCALYYRVRTKRAITAVPAAPVVSALSVAVVPAGMPTVSYQQPSRAGVYSASAPLITPSAITSDYQGMSEQPPGYNSVAAYRST